MTGFETVRDFIVRTYGVDGWLSDEAQEALAALGLIEQQTTELMQSGEDFLRSYLDASVSDEEGLLAALDVREWTAMWQTVDEKAQAFGRALAGSDTPADRMEFVWLIERVHEGSPVWLQENATWTSDARLARRFDTREAAQRVIAATRSEAVAVEHGFAVMPADSQEDKT